MIENMDEEIRKNLNFRFEKLGEQFPECEWLQDFAGKNEDSGINSMMDTLVDISELEDDDSVFTFSDN